MERCLSMYWSKASHCVGDVCCQSNLLLGLMRRGACVLGKRKSVSKVHWARWWSVGMILGSDEMISALRRSQLEEGRNQIWSILLWEVLLFCHVYFLSDGCM